MSLNKVPSGKNLPDDFNVVIEISMHSEPIKYEVDKESGAIFVDRFMSTAMHYPCNYGYIPHTISPDGDPVDVLVVAQFALPTGVVVRCRPVGMLDMEDVVQVWQSPLIPNGPLVMRSSLPQEMKDKIVAFYKALPTEDYECFRSIENGDFKDYTPVTPEFYQPIIDARKSTIGG